MSLAAIQALGTDEMPTALAQRLDYQIEHILIDEFQDTSSSQARFLERLMQAGLNTTLLALPPERFHGWGCDAVYLRFRYADVALFLRASKGSSRILRWSR